jgi:hypothetical protein
LSIGCCLQRPLWQRRLAHAEFVPSEGMFAKGADPDIDALYKQQARETR